MRRQTSRPYPHQDEPDAEDAMDIRAASSSGKRPRIPSPTTSSHKARPPLRSLDSSHSVSSDHSHTYNQFIRRYRPGAITDEDPSKEHDNRYHSYGFRQLLDEINSDDSDGEGYARETLSEMEEGLLLQGLDVLRPSARGTASEPYTARDRERLEWQAMLASVLAGDILKAENTRIAVALKLSKAAGSTLRADLWLGIQAKLHGRTEVDERKRIDDRRLHIVDAACKEVMGFCVAEPSPGFDGLLTDNALKQVTSVLRRLDVAHSLYPSLRSFQLDYPVASTLEFRERCDALITWSTVISSLRQNIHILSKWTGSDTLNVTPSTSHTSTPLSSITHLPGEDDRGTTFVERLLKEDAMQREFEKGSMTTIHALVGTTRAAHVDQAAIFHHMNLPSLEQELVPLVTFLTSLAQVVLRVQLSYAQKLKNPDVLILDQMMEELKVKIGFACALKRQYQAFLAPDPGGNWNLPPCISDDYDSVILEALTFFFQLIYWKLKSGLKSIYYQETDTIEAQWATFSDVSLSVPGGPSLVAEQLSSLTHKLMVRITHFFDTQVISPLLTIEQKRQLRDRGLPTPNRESQTAFEVYMDSSVSTDKVPMTNEQLKAATALTNASVLARRFSNSAEYDVEDVPIDDLIAALVDTDHCLVYTRTWEEDGTFIIVHPNLRERPGAIQRIMMEAFHVTEADGDMWFMDTGDARSDGTADSETTYVLVLSQRSQFVWNGSVLMLDIPKFDLRLTDNRIRLIADGPLHRLTLAKIQFSEALHLFDEAGETPGFPLLRCLVESQAHLPFVNHELKKMSRATTHLAESVLRSVHHVWDALRDTEGYQELLQNWFLFASEHGRYSQKHMDAKTLERFGGLLLNLDISWVTFICDECDASQQKTFRWAITALEFTLHRTRSTNISDTQFGLLRQKVATCMTLLMGQFDILDGGTLEAKREKKRRDELLRKIAIDNAIVEVKALLEEDTGPNFIDPAVHVFWNRTRQAVRVLEAQRALVGAEQNIVGKVLDEERLLDRSLLQLAGSRANISIRWQQGRFIGAGSFGSVYLAVNLDSGSLMAVKEIHFQVVAGMSSIYTQIKDELSVMELLHHPNVVEFYGIEVHRDKVFIFEEYCQCGSLGEILEHGRIEDENITQVYTMQLLEGLAYLHSEGVLHRDIKPNSESYSLSLLYRVAKYADFGAAKILSKNHRSIRRQGGERGGGESSLAGTPMYMSPEVVRNDGRGRTGAMDIWSLGCVVLECATGKKPWSNIDNEWAVMFRIGAASKHPPLPDSSQLSAKGIDFIKSCLTIDPMLRPTAQELMEHPWMVDFAETLRCYEEAELATSPPVEMPGPESFYDTATVARQAAIIQEKEVESIAAASPVMSPLMTSGSHGRPPGDHPHDSSHFLFDKYY
ncbi:hypothetical protein EUX98_g1372 [Antrodiella citrinella]|uniref:Protein kinase domain-containing protein n=1 Tax=Antrodiella citrinella TaxID=2447956 RepID=A0A4S4N4F0_9APHY|nr:hypothetical protein EUX98_g1372 [Antrodiella citrinella]